MMYKMTEEQRNTLLFIMERLTVTGPDQGGLLSNAAAVLRGLERETEETGQETGTTKRKA